MNMRLMGISAEILHSMWIVFLLHIVFLDGNADGYVFLKGSKRSIQKEQTPQDFKISLIKNTNASFAGLPPNATLMKRMEMESPRYFDLVRKKRRFDMKKSVPICRFKMGFVRLTWPRLMVSNTVVKLMGGVAWHIRYFCSGYKVPCLGIDSSKYFSRCVDQMGGDRVWVYLPDYKGGWALKATWRYVKITKSCVCRISNKPPN